MKQPDSARIGEPDRAGQPETRVRRHSGRMNAGTAVFDGIAEQHRQAAMHYRRLTVELITEATVGASARPIPGRHRNSRKIRALHSGCVTRFRSATTISRCGARRPRGDEGISRHIAARNICPWADCGYSRWRAPQSALAERDQRRIEKGGTALTTGCVRGAGSIPSCRYGAMEWIRHLRPPLDASQRQDGARDEPSLKYTMKRPAAEQVAASSSVPYGQSMTNR